MRNNRHYSSAVTLVSDQLTQVHDLLRVAEQAMQEGRPEDAREFLEHARGVIAGAVVVAEWAARLPDRP